MASENATSLEIRSKILSDLWLEHRNDPDFADLMEYCDIGFPLAYALAYGIITSNEQVDKFVNEAFDQFLETVEIEDEGYESLKEVFLQLDLALENADPEEDDEE